MVEAGTVAADLELTATGKQLLEMSSAMRRFGRLETALPEAYKVLADAPDEELRQQLDVVFRRLFDLLHG